MAALREQAVKPEGHSHESPKMYIIGYILSLILTVAAFGLALSHTMSFVPLSVTLLVLATLQIFVQLFFFMHVTESNGPAYHVMTLILGAILVITIVGGSIWIMTFNSQVL